MMNLDGAGFHIIFLLNRNVRGTSAALAAGSEALDNALSTQAAFSLWYRTKSTKLANNLF